MVAAFDGPYNLAGIIFRRRAQLVRPLPTLSLPREIVSPCSLQASHSPAAHPRVVIRGSGLRPATVTAAAIVAQAFAGIVQAAEVCVDRAGWTLLGCFSTGEVCLII